MLCVFELNEHDIETPLYFSYPNGYAERAGAAYILAHFHHAITRLRFAADKTFTTAHACFFHASQGLERQPSRLLHLHRKLTWGIMSSLE